MADLAIAVVAGFNWLTHCAGLVEVNRERFSGTLSTFRKIVTLAQQWWAMEGADARYSQMLAEQQVPPLMLYLVWLEYTRLAKEIASAASFGPSIDRAIEKRRETLAKEFADRPGELGAALDELRETMAGLRKRPRPVRPEQLSASRTTHPPLDRIPSRPAYFASTGSGGTLSFGASACMVISVIETRS